MLEARSTSLSPEQKGKPLRKGVLEEFREKLFTYLTPPNIIAPHTGYDAAREQLRDRLSWTSTNPLDREDLAREKRQMSTDLIRGTLLPRYQKSGVDILTQIRLIHRAHTRRLEHILLDPNQANDLRETLNYAPIDRLAGVLRSLNKLPIDIGFGNQVFYCATYRAVPRLMQKLADQAETLFPADSINEQVNQNNIYLYLSVFQYLIALIHPFYEGNGRTSEDAMYILWGRRPDLSHTLRFVSENGFREGQKTNERMTIMDQGALSIIHRFANQFGVTNKKLQSIKDFPGMINHLAQTSERTPLDIRIQYRNFIDDYLEEMIDIINNANRLSNNPTIHDLAWNLKRSSPVYWFKQPNKYMSPALEKP